MLNISWDERRDLIVPGGYEATLKCAVEHFVKQAGKAIVDHGSFFVAVSGGSTPRAIFEKLCSSPYQEQIDWAKVHLFWSDERSVPLDHPDSNYKMALDAGFGRMPIPHSHIHRMCAESHIQDNALAYEGIIQKTLGSRRFDLVMLGLGEDGHTASLFPHTEGLEVVGRLIIANFIPQLKTWRMTMTLECINHSHHSVVYVLGVAKKYVVAQTLKSGDQFPAGRVGTKTHKALWIIDEAAGELLCASL